MILPIEKTPQPINHTTTDFFLPPIIDSIDTLTTWDTPENNRHNVRVLCDLSGFNLNSKNIITACVEQESNFYNYMPVTGLPVKHVNLNKDGTVSSTDWGICQFNDGTLRGKPLWIGEGAYFSSVEDVLENPEKAVRKMIDCYKMGHLNWWVSYSSGEYLKYMP